MRLDTFARANSGNVAILFGLTLVPILGLSGLALDYSRSSDARGQLQSALDATALAVAHRAPGSDQAALETFADEFFAASFPEHDRFGIEAPTVELGDGWVRVRAEGGIETTLMAALGHDHMEIAADSQVAWGEEYLEVALVLDNTGSMSGDKIRELKRAAHSMLNELDDASFEPGSVRVAIVPYATQVNIGTRWAEEGWLDNPFLAAPGEEEDGENAAAPGDGSAGAPAAPAAEEEEWAGCVRDREQPYDTHAAFGAGDVTASLTGAYAGIREEARHPAVSCASQEKLEEMQPLTDDFLALRGKIDALRESGMTNITIGLAWGLATLNQQAMLDSELAGMPPDEIRRFVVLLTDGDNTQNRWSRNENAINERTRRACQAIKDNDIGLYTIRVIEGNAALLRECASSEGMYYDVANAGDLTAVFDEIAKEISQLRITR